MLIPPPNAKLSTSIDIMSLRHGLFISLTSLALHSLSAVAISAIVPAATLQSCAAGLNGQVPVPTPPGFDFSGKVRTYYIAAEEVEWDYAPTGWDNWLGVGNELSSGCRPRG